MSDKKSTTIFISIIAIIAFIIAIAYASYAFFTANIKSEGNNSVEVNTTQLSSKFEDNGLLNITNMIPGDYFTRTFTLENLGKEISYKVVVNDLINEFESYEDITYVLKEDNVIIKEGIFPKLPTNNEISDVITIKTGEKKSYSITITYQNTEVDQRGDMGKKISGKLFIKEV